MCLIAFAYQQHPRYRLILAANRDEFYQRPTQVARFWDDYPHILAGRDLQAGGSWLGINRNGRFAAITNYRESGENPAPRSRGELVSDFLCTELSSSAYIKTIDARQAQYNGYNLLVDDGKDLSYCSNRHHQTQRLQPGVYGLSNHLLNTPWPKVCLAKLNIESLLENDDITALQLVATLSSQTLFNDEQLPATGISAQWERALSPPFVSMQGYGTRCSSALLIDYQGNIEFVEQSFLDGRELASPVQFRWQVSRHG